ncbi:DUF1016 domain-containing protein [Candidatus Woesearchaeota archaeon]|nr:DUF1016 domain-containing protein [Candidatus Woesearchaeota archaeon]
MTKKLQINQFNNTYTNIRQILERARNYAYHSVNYAMVMAYWQIGKIIVEEEQKGEERAEYGFSLIKEISHKLTKEYGNGFTERNIWYMREFYLKFKKVNALRAELTWTHYRLLLQVQNENARTFYMHESVNSRWSTRQLERQINSMLYERLVLSKDKKKIKQLSKKGQIIQKPEDIVKDPYILEFLGLKENKAYLEKDMEKVLIDKLKDFMLELGKGFSFVARQKRICVDEDNFYIDLVFYNYLLRCFVLIDLKIGKLTHEDIGQMDFYTRYFEKEEKQKEDNSTIGIILCSDKNEAMVKYTALNDKKNLFASKYKLYLPSEKELKQKLIEERKEIEMKNRYSKPQ